MDLELCTRVWCKNWLAKELVPPRKAPPEFLICEEKTGPTSKLFRLEIWFGTGTVCMRWTDLELFTGVWCNWRAKEFIPPSKVLPEFLDLWGKDWSSKLFRLEIWFGTPRVSACAEWILNFVQEFGVRTDLQRSWFHQVKLFLSFSICEVKTGPQNCSG